MGYGAVQEPKIALLKDAQAWAAASQFPEAIAICLKLLASNPDDADAAALLAGSYIRMGDFAAATRCLRQFTRAARNPIPASIYTLLAQSALGSNDNVRAAAALKMATHTDPKQARTWTALGNLYGALGHWQRAIGSFEAARALEPDNKTIAFALASACQYLGEFARAFELYSQLLQSGFERQQVLFHLSGVLLEMGRPAEARPYLNSVATASSDPAHCFLLGLTEFALGHIDSAQKQFHQASLRKPISEPNNPQALRRLRSHREDCERYRKLATEALHFAPSGSLIRSSIDWESVARELAAKDTQFVVVDDFIDVGALKQIRDFVNRGEWGAETDTGDEIRSSLLEGFVSKLLLTLSANIGKDASSIVGQLPFTSLWLYKYFPNRTTRVPHADAGKISFNIWITPDEYNKGKMGGLRIWPVHASAGYFGRDKNWQRRYVEQRLRNKEEECFVIPYKYNRAIIFDSTLIHQTDEFHFDESHIGRRANITLTYGSFS
jgi:tetratricopeptide (TPR) repeat protein